MDLLVSDDVDITSAAITALRDSLEEARRAKIALEGFPTEEGSGASVIAGSSVRGSMFSASAPAGVEIEDEGWWLRKAVFMLESNCAGGAWFYEGVLR